jgi:hypothetical protein
MSSAFVKEGDEMWLHEVKPTLQALMNYLTRDNGGLRITQRGSYYSEELGTEVFRMSDGFEYYIRDNTWQVVE